jgi:hypothetical protein
LQLPSSTYDRHSDDSIGTYDHHSDNFSGVIYAPKEDYRRKLNVAYDRKNIFLVQAIGVGLDP